MRVLPHGDIPQRQRRERERVTSEKHSPGHVFSFHAFNLSVWMFRCRTRHALQVMGANLLLFKTVIAGDSWGEIAVPVIEEYPATALIFMGSLLTLVFGVLNLIVAVVDTVLN